MSNDVGFGEPSERRRNSAAHPISRLRSVLLRGVLGLALLALVSGGTAALMYATIEPGLEFARDPDAAARNQSLSKIRYWRDIDVSQPASAGSAAGDDMLVVDARALNGLRLSTAQKHLQALQDGADGQRRPVLATLLFDRDDAISPLFGVEMAPVDQLIARGVDGIVLDVASRFRMARAGGARVEADLALRIAQLGLHARALNPGFIIVLRNASAMSAHQSVMRTIDGVAEDNLLFGLDGPGRRNSRTDIGAALHDLNRARKNGRVVFVTEYLSQSNGAARRRIAEELGARGFVPVLPFKRPTT